MSSICNEKKYCMYIHILTISKTKKISSREEAVRETQKEHNNSLLIHANKT